MVRSDHNTPLEVWSQHVRRHSERGCSPFQSLLRPKQIADHVEDCFLGISALLPLLLVTEAHDYALIGASNASSTSWSAAEIDSHILAFDVEVLLPHQGVLHPAEPDSVRVLPLVAFADD